MAMHLLEGDGDKLIIARGWRGWSLWRFLQRLRRPRLVQLTNPAAAMLPQEPPLPAGSIGQVIERNGLFRDLRKVAFVEGGTRWCYEDDLEMI